MSSGHRLPVADLWSTDRAADRARRALPRLVGRSYAVVRDMVAEADARPAGAEREDPSGTW